jgi:hypothetical protein
MQVLEQPTHLGQALVEQIEREVCWIRIFQKLVNRRGGRIEKRFEIRVPRSVRPPALPLCRLKQRRFIGIQKILQPRQTALESAEVSLAWIFFPRLPKPLEAGQSIAQLDDERVTRAWHSSVVGSRDRRDRHIPFR